MSSAPIKLVVGLGNPGPKYARTRHNAGFWFVEELARRHGGHFAMESRFGAEVAKIRLPVVGEQGERREEPLWLLKPQSFMNRSGSPLASFAHFQKIEPAQILIAHDELDLLPGVVRLKFDGGHGGHNGLRDSIATIGSAFWRLRLGIGHPGHKDLVTDYVLHIASSAEQASLDAAVLAAADALPLMLLEGAERAMHRLHSRS